MIEFEEMKAKGRVIICSSDVRLGELSKPDDKWILSYMNNYFGFDSSDLKQISSKLDDLNGSK